MAKEDRVKILLECPECGNRFYSTTKNRRNTRDKLKLKKYCKFCKKHTEHKEVKAK
ncbi:MAG: 50S ribosomal protein L33 [Candidatus Mcinerneyibacterium aminivorans]|uniref:Large ribosomal subunit protein bL33 n=1 Tax=Candidatus Mcinerneyibacterium aminivorans TaxID=2703815 RepID=A0A5D0MGV8_9BACT|nr:MAG: 50S ribosomal protein L33 [Candidatus Mcinerneyibacterium aminivorans]